MTKNMFRAAAIALLLGWTADHARANTSSPTLVGLSRDATSQPRSSTWSGSSWSTSAALSSFGNEAVWVRTANCPTRNETALLALDYDSDVNICLHNGSSWGSVTELGTNAGTTVARPIDLAYEQVSGDLLICYWKEPNKLAYRTYSGTSISSESTINFSATDSITYLALTPKPRSNEILLLAVNSNKDIIAAIWNGSSMGAVTTLETDTGFSDSECFAAAYESITGELLVVYSENGQTSPRYRTYSGSWSAESTVPSIGGNPKWIRLAADPTSDRVLFAACDSSNDLNVNTWSGSAWGTNAELETELRYTDRRVFDLAFECGGGGALLAYNENGSMSIRYRTWSESGWSSELTGSSYGDNLDVVQVNTGASSGEVWIACSNDSDDLKICLWNGNSLGSLSTVETSLGGDNTTEQFCISIPAVAPPTPANVPYSTDFQSTVGNEWWPKTTSTNSTYTTFLGRFHSNSASLTLNTTVGETYSLTFDLYTIDSWDGTDSSNTWGPDAFLVRANGAQILNYTYAAEWPDMGQSYPWIYDQMGAYGYTSGWQDSVYRCVQATFTAASTTTVLSFVGNLKNETNDGMTDESWGIDNVSVKAATFIDVSTAAGFNRTTTSGVNEGSGLHWGDIDNDGDLDCILTGGGSARKMTNTGDGSGYTFTASTFGTGVVREQGALVDIDNDGDLDFWSCEATGDGVERLFQNNGSGTFTDVGNKSFTGPGTNEGMGTVDINKDGWPDLLIFSDNGNWVGTSNASASSLTFSGSMSSSYGLNGSGSYGARGYCASGDVNNDGYLDFYYHYNSGRLFISTGLGTYTRNNYGISTTTGGSNECGGAWGDYDNDGDLDLYVPRLDGGYTGTLWRNDRNWTTGTGNFTNVTASSGVGINTGVVYTPEINGARSACWGDYDNDGYLDLFILGDGGNSYLECNNGDGTFTRVGEGIIVSGQGHDCCFVDYDNDGDLDLAITRNSASTLLFQNRNGNGNFLRVILAGAGSGKTPKSANGTRVELWNAAGTTRLARRDVGTARGFAGEEPLWAHFGGVDPMATYVVKVYWPSLAVSSPQSITVTPSGSKAEYNGVSLPQSIIITEQSKAKIIKWREIPNKA